MFSGYVGLFWNSFALLLSGGSWERGTADPLATSIVRRVGVETPSLEGTELELVRGCPEPCEPLAALAMLTGLAPLRMTAICSSL